jgi:hypothetical protein
MQLIQVMQDLFQSPPIPYEPAKHSPKAWAKYCLQNRGFTVVYAQEADFAIESRNGEKTYFKVTDNLPESTKGKFGWIILDAATSQAQVIAPQG